MFIVIEGLDRSGKTTQVHRLEAYLDKHHGGATSIHCPDRSTRIGGLINDYLGGKINFDDHTIHLLLTANRWEIQSALKQTLAQKHVVASRYYPSVAYSVAKGLPLSWCFAAEDGILEPDLIIYLDIDPKEAAKRGGYGEERYERLEFQERVKEAYRSTLNYMGGNVLYINASLPEDEVWNTIKEHVDQMIL